MSNKNIIELLEKAKDIGIYGGHERAIELVKQAIAELKEQTQQEDKLVSALAECRDAFPAPEPGAEGEQEWASAMGDPLCVPRFVQKMVSIQDSSQDHEQWLQQACDNIEQALLHHRMHHLREAGDPDSGFPLLDHLSTSNNTQTGKDEIEMIVESIYFAMKKIPELSTQSPHLPEVDEIAQQIRFIDGNHQMGAGALAEKLHEWFGKRILEEKHSKTTKVYGVGV